MEAATTSISPRPALGAWLVGLGSLFIVLVFSVAALTAGKALRERYLFEAIEAHLKFKEYGEAEKLAEQIASPPLLLRPARLIAPAEVIATRHRNIQIAKVILSVTSALSVNRLDEAQHRLLSLPSGAAEPLIQRTQEGLNSLVESGKKIETQQHLAADSQRALDAAATQGALVADEFGELVGLPAVRLEADDATLPMYDHGVLAGLPRLKGLRDDILDLNFLKVELEALQAKVKSGSGDAHGIFMRRMGELKASYAEISTKFDEALTQLEEAQDSSVALGRLAQARRAALQGDLAARALELLAPFPL